MRRGMLMLGVLLHLCACSNFVDSTRASIRGWCENTPEYCDTHAVK